MSLTLASLPAGFSWLHAATRPSREEVRACAHLLAHREGIASEETPARLQREAELQLWATRTALPTHRKSEAARAVASA